MKNLFAAASYSFNNFYNNLNTQGQMIFSTIMFLIVVLCVLLLVTYVIQGVQVKVKIKKIKASKRADEAISNPESKPVIPVTKVQQEVKPVVKESSYVEEKTEIIDIAKRVEDALKEETPINFTTFEEDQEKTAIISIDELMQKAKDLELIEDEDSTGVNYLEKYNLDSAEVTAMVNNTVNKETGGEVKAFKVSQVISPVYGVKKEVIDNGNN